MINSNIKNVRLKLENIQQLAEVESRLSVIQSEINNHQKILRGIKMECDRFLKEKLYQEELLENLKKDVEKLEFKKQEIEKYNSDSLKNLDQENKKTKDLSTKTLIEVNLLKEREKQLASLESRHKKEVDIFTIKNTKLLEDQALIKKVQDAFLKAISLIKW